MMKIVLIMIFGALVVSCSSNGAYERQRNYARQQLLAMDTIASFESLMTFYDELVAQTNSFDTLVEFSPAQEAELTALYDSLSSKMSRKVSELFPSDSVNLIE